MRKLPVLFVAALLLAAPALAHGPPDERAFESRVMVDENDDCGGHGAGGNCRGSHDLLGLNIREAYLEGQHVVVFTFLLELGDGEDKHEAQGTYTDTLTFTANGATKTIRLRTSDNERFTAVGALRVDVTDEPIQDQTRYGIDVVMKRSDVGVKVGDKLSGFQLEADLDGTRGDIMPGSYISPITGQPAPTTEPDTKCDQANSGCTRYTRDSVTLKGPVQYVALDPDASVRVRQGETAFVNLGVRNQLNDMAQTLAFAQSADAGVTAGFHDPATTQGDSYPATYQDSIAKSAQKAVHLAVTGEEAGRSGTIRVVLTTDEGGRVVEEVAFEVLAASDAGGGTGDGTGDGGGNGGSDGSEDAPAPALALLAIGLLAAAVRRR